MARIIVIGLGPGNPSLLTAAARQALFGGQTLFLRTGRHPLAAWLRRRGVRVQTFDYLYRRCADFSQVYRAITRRLIFAARREKTVCYAVPGHPLVGEAAVAGLRRVAPRRGITVELIPGLSFVEAALTALNLDLLNGVIVLDALAVDKLKEPHRQHLLLAQVYSKAVASRVKLKLLELYPPSTVMITVKGAGLAGQRLRRVPLYALDRQHFDHLTSVYIPPARRAGLGDLIEIMQRLRSVRGCPWDREQTHRSLRQYLVEEAYEVIAAIEQGDDAGLQEELGDVLLQVVFHSQIAREEGRFNLSDVIDTVSSKLVRRHPHVFGPERTASISQVMKRWEQIKRREKGAKTPLGPEAGLPALLGAYKIQRRAAEMGFDWPQIEGAVEKLKEETAELEDAYRRGISGKIEEEFGDFLFAAVNVARFLQVNPELALGKALRKFWHRFQYILEQAGRQNKPVSDYSLEQLDRWWEEAKQKGKYS